MRKIVLAAVALLILLSACKQQPVSSVPSAPAPSVSVGEKNETVSDRPTLPDQVAEGTEYLYDFSFSQRYDARVREEFSLVLPGRDTALALFEKYEGELVGAGEQCLDGEGMEPHIYRRYMTKQGDWIIATDYYEPDGVEYISFIWSTAQGAKTNRDIAVGSGEPELLAAYPGELYFLEAGETEPAFFARNEQDMLPVSFDCAYAWQPFAEENNDIRDITFYLKDGVVVAIEMMEPYELRYVYGYDREVGLTRAAENRNR